MLSGKSKRAAFLRPQKLFQLYEGVPLQKVIDEKNARYFKEKKTWVGIDGEGITLGEPDYINNDGSVIKTGTEHRYISICYRDAQGKGDELANPEGLKTKDCLDFILSIPAEYKIAAYGFGYDQTKILEELPNDSMYKLTHPETRSFTGYGRKQFHPVEWNGFVLDHFSTTFKVGQAIKGRKSPLGTQYYLGKDWRTIFDLIQFYQCAFVKACQLWKVGTTEERNIMREMKKDRRNLIRYTQAQILEYSNKECQWLAELAQKLDDACENVNIRMGRFYFGAGSLAKGLLHNWKIKAELPKKYLSNEGKDETIQIDKAARWAYFGGRFEIARRGIIRHPIHDYDISSAYPYQIYRLPCLLCGIWTKTTDRERVNGAQAAIVRYSLRMWKGALPSWGPFPFRDKDGSIPFPIESFGGWIHKDEYLIGEKLWPNVRFHGAWVYETKCGHRPFEHVKDVYLERMRIGKEGPGIVLKLGTNAIAGSIMQTIGTQPFFNAVWAGMITSGTRAQLLELLGQHEKWEDVIMMATDGLWSLKDVFECPKPIDTGTNIPIRDESITDKAVYNIKPLGGWEHNVFANGVFMARPGIYMPLGLTDLSEEENEKEDNIIKDVKGRGIGVKTLYKHRNEIIEHYTKTGGKKPYYIEDKDPIKTVKERTEPIGCERFVGLRGGIVQNDKGECHRRNVYGLWTLQQRIINFDAMPKRTEGDGPLFGDTDILHLRKMPKGQLSEKYDKMRPDQMFDDDAKERKENPTFYDSDQSDWGDE